MKLEKLIAKIFLAGALAAGPLMTGCEPDEPDKPEHTKIAAEGHAEVFGTWYKPEEGVTSSGWRWHWGYLYLEQEGTNVWGTESWEFYGPITARGFVDGNKMHLQMGSGEYASYLDGVVEGNTFNANYSFDSDGKTIITRRVYNRQSEDIPEGYY